MSDLYLSQVGKWLMSSPPAEWALRNMRDLLIGALKQGPIPQHIAFEMDGNRTYAKNHKIEAIEGHHHGFEALAKVLEMCYKSGVKVVTVYAFSIENYNRPKKEVEGLMSMAKVKLEQLIKHGELLDRYGAGIRILGQREMIRKDVLVYCDKAIEMTKHNTDAVLNICFPYTSRAEMTTAIQRTVEEFTTPTTPQQNFSQSRISQKIRSQKLKDLNSREPSPEPTSRSDVDDSMSSTTLNPDSPPTNPSNGLAGNTVYKNPETITAETIDNHMYTSQDPPLDIFVRTSGVTRLSDFMLWQCHQDTQIFFLKCLWPEFDLWNFIPVLLEWQWRHKQQEREERPKKLGRAVKAA